MISEKWKPIDGYEGIYEVSPLGQVNSLGRVYQDSWGRNVDKKEKMLKPFPNSNGYLMVCLYKHGKKYYRVHLLVWDAFCNKPRNGRLLQVDHIDNDKSNNRFDNLQLMTNRSNCSKGKQQYRSLPTGVSWHKMSGKYQAHIQIDGVNRYLGLFSSVSQASCVYEETLNKEKA